MSKQWLGMLVVGLLSTLTAGPGHAIEMFTFFGDGSRIGLPSLEVPIEAYPGIPLRSDRIRARGRGMRSVPAPGAQPGMPPGVTIRAMPAEQAAPVPPTVRATPVQGRSSLPMPPLPPEPDAFVQPGQEPTNAAGRPRSPVPSVTDPTPLTPKVQPPLVDPR